MTKYSHKPMNKFPTLVLSQKNSQEKQTVCKIRWFCLRFSPLYTDYDICLLMQNDECMCDSPPPMSFGDFESSDILALKHSKPESVLN